MRLLAIGDIHGCYTALETLMEYVDLTDDDMLVTLGDYVDRGPNTREVVQWVIDRSLAGQCIPLRGNHELMMLGALTGALPMQHWLQFGGRDVLASYSSGRGRPSSDDIPLDHLLFLERGLRPFYETESHIFVHATAAPNVPMHRQSEHDLFWERFDWIQPHQSGKTIVCGHTAQQTGVPASVGYAVCIDTWAYGGGWLTALDVETGQYWQANQRGETRTEWLEEYELS